jgi:hypothetical protein
VPSACLLEMDALYTRWLHQLPFTLNQEQTEATFHSFYTVLGSFPQEQWEEIVDQFSEVIGQYLSTQERVAGTLTQELHGLMQQAEHVMENILQQTKRQRDCNSDPIMEKRRKTLDFEATAILTTWLNEHTNNPYPSKEEKTALALRSGLSDKQINMWFSNARRRYVNKP